MKHHKDSTEVRRCETSSHLAESKILVLDLMLLYLSIDPLCLCHMSHKKNTSYFRLYWLVNRDPYNDLFHITG